MSKEDIYKQLSEWLTITPRALPAVDGPEFQELIRFLYTPEEAYLALRIKRDGGTLSELAARVGMAKNDLRPIIRSMQEKGTLYTQPDSDDPIYYALGVEAPGLIETTAGWGLDVNTSFGKKALELWGKFKKIYVMEGISELGRHTAAWCHVSVLPPDAGPEENLFEFLKTTTDYVAVFPCPCRLIEPHVQGGDVCDCINECCIVFNELARWSVEHRHAREISLDEAVEILKACETKGQVHTGAPGLFLCNCCKHACINIYAMKYGKGSAFAKNHFYAVVDSGACVLCGECVKRCCMGAIHVESDMQINLEKCIGCGACATGCAVNAIRMVRRTDEEIVHIDTEMFDAITKIKKMEALQKFK